MKFIILTILFIFCGLSAYALPKSQISTEVENSKITNINKDVTIDAANKSAVNTGIQARGASIKNSTLTNRFTGSVKATNSSAVTTGIKADGANIENSTIVVDTEADIQAKNATVKTGVDVSGVRDSEIKTKYTGTINASNSIVKAGTVEGNVQRKKISTTVSEDINANRRGIKIGTVSAGNGRASKYTNPKGLGVGPRRSGASIGNVSVDSTLVRKVDTEVGTGNFIKGMKTRHMAEFYKDKGGVDPSGTKHVFVSAKEKEKAKKRGSSVGNTTVKGAGKIRKINTFVE